MDTQLYRSILFLYQQQTTDEQSASQTKHQNGVGFNALDAGIGTSLAYWILEGVELSSKQEELARKILKKYTRQLAAANLDLIELPLVRKSTKSEKSNLHFTLAIEGRNLVVTPMVYPSTKLKEWGFRGGKNKAGKFSWLLPLEELKDNPLERLKANIIGYLGEPFSLTDEVKALLTPLVRPKVNWKGYADIVKSYQKDSVQFLLEHSKAMLTLSPGLGKSLVAILSAVISKSYPVLIVAPLTLLPMWRAEIRKWAQTDDIAIITKSSQVLRTWNITNYEAVPRLDNLDRSWPLIIVDESVMIKNRKAKRTANLKHLARRGDKVWLLTGAPVTRYLDDFWAQLNTLDALRFSSYWKFTDTYCVVERTQWGWKVAGDKPNALVTLKRDIRDVCYSVSMEDVLDIPEWAVTSIPVPMTLDQDKVYRAMEEDFLVSLSDNPENDLVAPNLLAQAMRLIQIASNPHSVGIDILGEKIKATGELLDFIPLPVIIWANFTTSIQDLEKVLTQKGITFQSITGKTPLALREKATQLFQEGKLQAIICQISTGKFGLTLTKARSAIFVERTYKGDDYYQALFRNRRIGTDFIPLVYNLISTRHDDDSYTIDHVIDLVLQDRKETARNLTRKDLALLR